jgi:hypothetical protein
LGSATLSSNINGNIFTSHQIDTKSSGSNLNFGLSQGISSSNNQFSSLAFGTTGGYKAASDYEGSKQSGDINDILLKNQPKEFVRETYEDGSLYEGDKCGGYRHGRGKFFYCDGGLYEGDWELGRMDGYGVLYYPNGKRAYEGEWSNDKFNGRGVVYNESPSNFVTEVNYYDLDSVEDFWVRYEGEFADDNKEGLGTIYFANAEKYTGTFKNDLAHGKGTFFKSDGTIVTGEWLENKLVRVY